MKKQPGAQFEISVDGKPRSYRDTKVAAIAGAEFLKSRNPSSEVAVKDLQSGKTTPVLFKPVRRAADDAPDRPRLWRERECRPALGRRVSVATRS
jgi:hypothetical protein